MEEMNEMDSIVLLTKDNGEEVKYEFLDYVEYEGNEYAILIEAEDENAEEVIILQVEDDENDPEMENYFSVEDEETLNAVFEIFKKNNEEDYNFID